jgi:hypothetical protein
MDIDPTRRSGRAHDNDFDPRPSVATSRRAPREVAPDRITTSADHDVVLGEMARAVRVAAPSAPHLRQNDDILYISANRGDATEGRALRGFGHVTTVQHGAVVAFRGARFDLSNHQGCAALARSLGLDPKRTHDLEELLLTTGGRAEIASLAIVLYGAEEGRSVPSRLVLSGHNAFASLFGDGKGDPDIDFSEIRRCAKLFPKGAALVRDINFSACSTSSEIDANRSAWIAAFPKLDSMWGYDGVACPFAARIGPHHAAWARGTAGATGVLSPSRELTDAGVIVWSRKGGLRSKNVLDPVAAKRVEARAALAGRRIDAWRSGVGPLGAGGHDNRELEADYRALQSMASRSSISPEQRRSYTKQAEVLNQIRDWDTPNGVRVRLSESHGRRLADTFRAAGLAAPDLAKMSRAEAMAAFRALDRALTGDVRARHADVVDSLRSALFPKPLGDWTIQEAGY